jgi:ParB family transcriptional regulator, chromosome partitioning protein
MSFKSNLEGKSLGFAADIAARKQARATLPRENPDEKGFSTAPGRTGDLQDRKWLTTKVAELTAALEDARNNASIAEIPLDKLVEVPGRRRLLTTEEYAELKENLRRNPMVTPITVRKLPDSRFEVVSGNNRVRIFQELDRKSILAYVLDSDESQSRINAFYANLLQTNLSDFEKFVGFKMLQDELQMSQTEIAEHSGKNESFVSRLMAFADLPAEALCIIERQPSIIGMTAAHQIATILKNDASPQAAERVTKAIEKLAAGEVDQKQAIKLAAPTAPSRSAASVATTVRSGKHTYCQLRRVSKVLRIDFKSEDEAQAVETAILEMLQNRAELARQLKE